MTNSMMTGLNPAKITGWDNGAPRKGFFTDTSVCIGCKACEVACKEWNQIPEDGLEWLGTSYDNTGSLGASTWRHVAFIEQKGQHQSQGKLPNDKDTSDFRWLMSSDVCKHCTEAGCLDVCPTGALFRTKFGTVVVQDDVCNGCGYCVPACPFGVIDRREGPKGAKNVGLAQKCTLCYDRLEVGMTPACAQACPTESIQFGDIDNLRTRAQERAETLWATGVSGARLYGHDPTDGVGGTGAIFLLLDEPEVYGLPPDPTVSTRNLTAMWKHAGIAALTLLFGAAAASLKSQRNMPKRTGWGGEIKMVPEATFSSYYGKPIVKASPWGKDIPTYLFLGGLAGGSSLLAAGADLGKHRILRRNTRITAVAAIGAGYVALVHDLGRPARFINMLRVAKPTSPMSVGTWILTLYGPAAGLAAAYEFRDLVPSKSISLALRLLGRPAGLGAAILGSLLASYTAVLLSDTATPTWHQGFKALPFIFVGSAACASSGMAMIMSPISQAAAARRLATGGAVIELIAMRKMEASIGVVSETLNLGTAGHLIKVSRILTIAGATGSLLFARKNRAASVASGVALTLGSACARFGIFEAGQNSAKDPKYTVLPQRERLLKDGARR